MGFLDPWDMQDLLQSIQHLHFGLDIILVTPLSQNKNRPWKSNLIPFLSNTFNFFKGYIILVKVFSIIEKVDPQYK